MVFGEELLTFAVEETLNKLSSITIDEVIRIWGLKKDLKKLKKTIESIQDILCKAEGNQETTGVNDWLVELRDLVYHADDVLDEFSYEILRRKIEIGEQLRHKVCNFVCCYYNPLLFRAKMAYKVKKINGTLADLKEQAMTKFAFGAAAGVDPRGAPSNQSDPISTNSLIDKSKPPVGRTKELNDIITFLKAKSSSRLNIVSIAGFGGLGKTTLAKLVHEQVKRDNLIDETVWVDVSKTSRHTDILGEMLQKVEGIHLTNFDAICGRLRAKLENKRFLLVLDNVWSGEQIEWKHLQSCLLQISESHGNSVIMTTRNLKLAAEMGNSSLLLMKLTQLEDEECWSIIKRLCELGEGSVIPEDLKSIGFDIAGKCKGVPLVAEVLGGTLCSKKDRTEWSSIRDSNVWESVGTDDILPVFRLSFDRLRSPLKQCFSYCSLYPKNHVFEKETLIQLWMAEGFLYETRGNASASKNLMEDIGEEFFNVLRGNSFFQDYLVDKWGNAISCKIHDLLHDLAISVSNRTMLNQDDGNSSYTFKTHDCRRVSFLIHGEQNPSLEDFVIDRAKEIRSLCTNKGVHRWTNFKSLRSLNLYGAHYVELPTTIGALKHLRYLDISKNMDIKELPKSITKLYNLQTLRIVDCHSLEKLPSKIGNLVSLRHIHFNDPKHVPFKVGSFINLRTLPLFVVRQEVGYEIQELKHLNELRGELEIIGLQHVRNVSEALAANLKGKKLAKLRLIWQCDDESDAENDVEREGSLRCSNCKYKKVLEGLVPPASIMRLKIEGYMGKLFPEWMSSNGGSESSLNHLAKLKLLGIENCEKMPTLGHLPRLKILEIERMINVKCIGSEFYEESKGNVKWFPVLEKLKLRYMMSLEEWEAPDYINHAFPSLQELLIDSCSFLKCFPLRYLFSLKNMEIDSCHKLISLSIVSTSLEYLVISRCKELASISSSQNLTSLKILKIFSCPKLTSIPNAGLLSLETLTIKSCPKLVSLPQGLKSIKDVTIHSFSNLSADAFRGLSSLELLEIENIENMELMPSVEDLISLKELRIKYCKNLRALPVGLHLLKCLQMVEILWCYKLRALRPEIKSCTSLKYLSVVFCGELVSIENDTIRSLTQLETLKLGPFSDELVEFPGFDESQTVHNPSLQDLILHGNGKIKSLPYLGHLTALKKLEICDFGISELPIWLGKLSSLEYLWIENCKCMISLPQSMQELSKLTRLRIFRCLLLAQKFEEDLSAVWPNISHIAYIVMDDEVIQDLRSGRNP